MLDQVPAAVIGSGFAEPAKVCVKLPGHARAFMALHDHVAARDIEIVFRPERHGLRREAPGNLGRIKSYVNKVSSWASQESRGAPIVAGTNH